VHSNDPIIVHGDLKGVRSLLFYVFSLMFVPQANVLINDMGHACLADFGLSRILEELSGSASTTSNLAGSIRWMAPELIIDSHRPTALSDMYAFGSLMLEVSSNPHRGLTFTLTPYHFIAN
jgi:serine/threonine protein kinase